MSGMSGFRSMLITVLLAWGVLFIAYGVGESAWKIILGSVLIGVSEAVREQWRMPG